MIKIEKILIPIVLLLLTGSALSRERVEIAFSELVKNNAGFIIDEVKSIYNRVGVEPKVSIYPESRLVALFEKGKVDAMGAKADIYEKISPGVIKIDVPIIKDVEFRVFIKANQLYRMETLKDPIIIVADNCLSCLEFAKVHKMKVSSYLDTIRQTLKILYLGRADMVIAPITIVSKLPKGMFMIYGEKSYKTNFYHYIDKSIAHLKDKLEIEFRKSSDRNSFDLNQLGDLTHILD